MISKREISNYFTPDHGRLLVPLRCMPPQSSPTQRRAWGRRPAVGASFEVGGAGLQSGRAPMPKLALSLDILAPQERVANHPGLASLRSYNQAFGVALAKRASRFPSESQTRPTTPSPSLDKPKTRSF